MRLLSLAVSLILILSWAPRAWSQKGMDSSTPIRIEADRMETFQEENIVLFSGNVSADQGRLNIQAEKMTVIYGKEGAPPQSSAGTPAPPGRQIEKITAEGNVKIVQGDWVAAGDAMDFNADDRIVILSGNAKVWQDQNMVSGEKIILYLEEGKSVVERSAVEGERVKAFIYPSGQDNKDPGKPLGQ